MSNRLSPKSVGVLCTLAAAVCWGFEPIVGRYASASAPFIQSAYIRVAVALLIVWLYVAIFKVSLQFPQSSRPALIFNAVFAGVIADVLFILGITYVSALNAVILSHLQPLVIVLLGAIVFKHERLTRVDLLGMVLMIVAAGSVAARTFERLIALEVGSFGDSLIVISTVLWGSATVMLKRYAANINAASIAVSRFTIAICIMTPMVWYERLLYIDNFFQIGLGLILGVGGLFYYEGLVRLKAALLSSLELSAAFFSAVGGYIFFNETITYFQCGAIAVMFIAILLLSKHDGNS